MYTTKRNLERLKVKICMMQFIYINFVIIIPKGVI